MAAFSSGFPAYGLRPTAVMSSSSSIITPPSTTPGGSSLGNSTVLQVISEEVDTQSCALLGPLAVAIQGLLGLAVLSSLLVKRARETPRRPWKIWAMDVSKQVIGQMFLHGSNLLISDVTALKHAKNSCSLYLCNILIDTTLGVFILYIFLQLAAWLFITQLGYFELRTGWYGDPPQASFWAKQLVVYIGCLAGMKAVVVAMFGIWPWLYEIGDWLLEWVADDPDAQVIISILVVPVVMNVFQFLLIDQIIKGYSSFTLLSDEESPEPLLGDHNQLDDDEDDDDEGHSRVAPLDDSKSSRTGGDGASPSKTSFAKEAAYLDQHQNQTSLMESVTVEADPALKSRKDYGTSRPGSPSPTTAAETDRQT